MCGWQQAAGALCDGWRVLQQAAGALCDGWWVRPSACLPAEACGECCGRHQLLPHCRLQGLVEHGVCAVGTGQGWLLIAAVLDAVLAAMLFPADDCAQIVSRVVNYGGVVSFVQFAEGNLAHVGARRYAVLLQPNMHGPVHL